MSIYQCNTHKTTIEVNGNTRRISVYLGAGNGGRCKINTTKNIKEGKFDDCEIKKIKD